MPVQPVEIAVIIIGRKDPLQAPRLMKTSGQCPLTRLPRLMVQRDLQQCSHNIVDLSKRVRHIHGRWDPSRRTSWAKARTFLTPRPIDWTESVAPAIFTISR